jgi:hypothetical protein
MQSASVRFRSLTVSVAILATPWLATGAQRAAPTRNAAPLARNGQLTLRNVTSDTLRVELRIGDAADCAVNRQGVTRLLAPGKRWLVAVPTGVCWRQQRVARGAGIAWAPWRRQVVSVGQREEIALQDGT